MLSAVPFFNTSNGRGGYAEQHPKQMDVEDNRRYSGTTDAIYCHTICINVMTIPITVPNSVSSWIGDAVRSFRCGRSRLQHVSVSTEELSVGGRLEKDVKCNAALKQALD